MQQDEIVNTRTNYRRPDRVPSLAEIDWVIKTSYKRDGTPLELTWSYELGPRSKTIFTLKARLDRDSEQVAWLFTKAEQTHLLVEWSYISSDAALIHSMVIASCPEVSMASIPSLAEGHRMATKLREAASVECEEAPSSIKTAKTLKGNLGQYGIDVLVQSIASVRMLGMLQIIDASRIAKLWFSDGQLIHADNMGMTGDEAVIDTLTWNTGTFEFLSSENCPDITVTKHHSVLLLAAASFVDSCTYLQAKGLDLNSFVVRKEPYLREAEFESKMRATKYASLKLQRDFYECVGKNCRLLEIIRVLSVPKSAWIAALHNLVLADLVQITDRIPIEEKTASSSCIVKHEIPSLAATDRFMSLIKDNVYDVYKQEFLFVMLDWEFSRFQASGTPFSIVTIKPSFSSRESHKSSSQIASLQAITRAIQSQKRKSDLLFLFYDDQFLLFLPCTGKRAVRAATFRIMQGAIDAVGVQEITITLELGFATAPDDCLDLSSMLEVATTAPMEFTL